MFAVGPEPSSAQHSMVFGELWNVFPIGEFTYVWSRYVDDMNYYTMQWQGLGGTIPGTNRKLPPTMLIAKGIKKSDYTNENLQAATESGNEIMIRCEEYYAIPKSVVSHHNDWKDMF